MLLFFPFFHVLQKKKFLYPQLLSFPSTLHSTVDWGISMYTLYLILSIYLSIYLSIHLSIHFSSSPSIYLFVYLSFRLSLSLSISLTIYLSIHFHLFFRSWTVYEDPVPGVRVCVRQVSPFLPSSYSEASLPVCVFHVDVENTGEGMYVNKWFIFFLEMGFIFNNSTVWFLHES